MKKSLPLLAAGMLLAGCPNQAGTGPGAGAAPGNAPTLQAVKQIPVGKAPHGMWAAGGFVYNADVGDARVSVIDAAKDEVATTIPVAGGAPNYVRAFADGKAVMVADKKQGNLLVIDPAQGHKVLQTIAIGKDPDKIRVEGDTVLVSCATEPKLVHLTFQADRSQTPARREFAIGANTGDHRDAALARGWVVAPNPADNNVSVVDLAAGTTQAVSGGNNPGPVGVGTTGEAAVAAIVGNVASNTVTIFALPGLAPTTLEGTGLSATDMVIDAPLGRAFISMAGSNELAVVDYVNRRLVGKVPTGARPVHVYLAPATATSGDHEVWVGNDSGDSVTVVDGETLRVKATVMTDKGHHKMAFSGTKAYVSNIAVNNVSVVDRTLIR